MSIHEKLKREDLFLVDILRHPVLGAEYIRNYDVLPETREGWDNIWEEKRVRDDSYYVHTNYQKLMACDFNKYVVFCTARAVGKTETLLDKIVFYLVNNFWGTDNYMVFIAPNKVHVDPVFRKLTRWLRNNNFLKHLVDFRSINMGSLDVKLKTGATLDTRIAGTSGTGANVVGLHTPFILLDEASYFGWQAWIELQRSFNEWMVGAQMVVAGVPDGRRERNVLYHADQENNQFTKHRVASARNPRWTAEAEENARIQFGGVNSEAYVHMVLGEHGSPVWAVFDRALMLIENYETVVKELWGNYLKEDAQLGFKQILELPPVPRGVEDVIFGIDLGYTDPTAIIIMYRYLDRWRQLARLIWKQVSYDHQKDLISFLITRYNPTLVGIDEGSSGKAVIHDLLNAPKYAEKHLEKVVIPINFSASIPIGKDEDGKDITVRTKEFGVPYLQQLANSHKIVFPEKDEELITELERTTYTKSPSGHLVFRTYTERGGMTGDDHNLAAYLAAFVGWYLENETLNQYRQQVSLYSPKWII